MTQANAVATSLTKALEASDIATATPYKPAYGFWASNPVFSHFADLCTTVNNYRTALGLKNPGTIENLNKEVSRDVLLNQYAFTGLRADLNKAFSLTPAFQTSHTLSIGSPVLPSYAFSAVFAADDYFVQGNIDDEFSFSGRINYGWSKTNVSKVTLQLTNGQPSMVQLEQDYQGSDFSVNVKSLNPSFLYGGFSGIAVASLLQSFTPRLALGLEAMYSKQPGPAPADTSVSYVARFNNGNWIASAQLQAQGALVASYWRRVSEKVEAGVETQISANVKPLTDSLMGTPIGYEPIVEGHTTIGAKYEYRAAVFRGQIESTGKVAAFMEKRVLPTVLILFSGEIDQFKNTSKVGMGLQFESAGNEKIMMMQQGMIDAEGNPIPGAPQL